MLDLKSDCVLRESLEGYRAALGDEQRYITEAAIDIKRRGQMLIVPGLGYMDSATAQKLCDCVAEGMHLLLESGGAFLSAAKFAAHKEVLVRHFGIVVEPPIDLWTRKANHDNGSGNRSRAHRRNRDSDEFIPYVNYVWPRPMSVRDFSRVISVSARVGDAIGSIGSLAVALKKRVGNGTLIFLGSPLGPALRAGDREAHSWLRAIAAEMTV